MKSFDTPSTRVIFFQVRDSAAKLKQICASAKKHFAKKEPFLILVEDERAERFVDDLLWKNPVVSFLPHVITEEATKEWIAITKAKKNVNGARVAFNLCPTPLMIEGPFRIIYELEDLSSGNKRKFSSLRFDAYKQLGFSIEGVDLH